MAEVGAREVRRRLGVLLSWLADGERVAITKHGVPVAEVIPAGRARKQVVAETIASIKEFRKGRRLGRTTIARTVPEGRR